MADYPNNSHSAREKTGAAAGQPEKKPLEKVVTGAAKTRKKSEARSSSISLFGRYGQC